MTLIERAVIDQACVVVDRFELMLKQPLRRASRSDAREMAKLATIVRNLRAEYELERDAAEAQLDDPQP